MKFVKLAAIIVINLSLGLEGKAQDKPAVLLKNIKGIEWNRTVVHPDYGKQMSIWYLLGQYAWHGKHHTAHINKLRERMGWN